MLGKQSDQRGLWGADSLYIEHVGRGSFYGLLASLRGELFRDEDFAELYCTDNGRDSVPPSLLATALLLQTYDRASDAEAKQRADFDIRWKVALGIEVESRPFAKSTLQLFRARLILHEKAREVFERSLRFARKTGYLKGRRMKVALDTTYVLGRGAVKDTYNLLSDGIVKLMRALSELEGSDLAEWASANGYQRYVAASVKGEACIDWDDRTARAALLGEIAADGDRLLELSWQAQELLDEDRAGRQRIVQASELLGRLLLQDVERTEDGVCLKNGVSRDRMVSVHDPEMRHGHKSSSKRFDGHKASVAVDTDSQVITAVDVLPGNASDSVGALEMVERTEEGTCSEVEETIGDVAYGDGGTRQSFADARPHTDSQATPAPGQQALPEGGLRDRPGVGDMHLSCGAYDPEVVQDGYTDRQNGAHSPVESLLVRCCGLWSVSATRAVCGISKWQRSDGETSSAGGAASAGSYVTEKRPVCRVSSASGGGGAQVGSPGTAWSKAGAILRTRKDAVPAIDGGGCSQPDAGGWQSRDDGRSNNRLSVLQLLSPPYICNLAGRYSYRPETIAGTDNFCLAVTLALRNTGFSSELLGRRVAVGCRGDRLRSWEAASRGSGSETTLRSSSKGQSPASAPR